MAAPAQPFRWNGAYGYEYIPATGFYHVDAREYDPRTARWLQRDPIDAASGDPNLYRYAGNAPVNQADPTGLDWLDNTANFFAGWGDRLTGDLTKYARDWLCDLLNLPRFEVDPCDEWYLAGHLVGAVHDRLLTRGLGRGAGAVNKLANQGSKQPKGGVYVITDKRTGETAYVGQSSDVSRRQREWQRSRYPEEDYDFSVPYRTDDYATRRGLEQLLFDELNPRDNKNTPISPRNPRRREYIDAVQKFLNRPR